MSTEQTSENIFTYNLKCIVKFLLYCGREYIAFRTRNVRNLDEKENPGNFIAFLKVYEEQQLTLQTHLNSLTIKNTTYLFPYIQNELINIEKKLDTKSYFSRSWLMKQLHIIMKYVHFLLDLQFYSLNKELSE